ncbi:uncharacterized protein N7459_006553 [Penicillium hispanicum]|uniref:uncharacterized protein n=1 Tax=Penicillium hispanicum TaxID=1080232 RepID=UPI002542673E|nr:uncharacterized protein N7459_006553 [Penicillium hispanicum]KAJ5577589.1 hypothetical protein N7459_006553 [Penicillium hispanicum]
MADRDMVMFEGASSALSTRASSARSAVQQYSGRSGASSDNVVEFCPLKAMMAYPYRFAPKDKMEELASKYFSANNFWKHQWSVYYLQVPPEISGQPVLFVPIRETRLFMDQINHEMETDFRVGEAHQKGLVVKFQTDSGLPKPVFLIQCRKPGDSRKLQDIVINHPLTWAEMTYNCDKHAVDALLKQIREAVDSGKKSKKKKPVDYLPRAQQLLQDSQPDYWKLCLDRLVPSFGLKLDILELGEIVEVPQFPYPGKPIFISIDCEWNELRNTELTEVGISILDTMDLVRMSPGEGGSYWKSAIVSCHLRVMEHRFHINSVYCKGSQFFNFGVTELIPLENVKYWVDKFFFTPYGANMPDRAAVGFHKQRGREVVLVGHDPQTDIRMLKHAGSFVFQEIVGGLQIREVIDTQKLFSQIVHDPHPQSLQNVLNAFNIQYSDLHNAGNDARYTMEVLVAMALWASS